MTNSQTKTIPVDFVIPAGIPDTFVFSAPAEGISASIKCPPGKNILLYFHDADIVPFPSSQTLDDYALWFSHTLECVKSLCRQTP